MNTLPPAGDDAWRLPRHAHVVVYRAEAGEDLLTIYDCGAAQKPPSAQVTGYLRGVAADCETERTPTGSVVRLREPALLIRDGDDWRVDLPETPGTLWYLVEVVR